MGLSDASREEHSPAERKKITRLPNGFCTAMFLAEIRLPFNQAGQLGFELLGNRLRRKAA